MKTRLLLLTLFCGCYLPLTLYGQASRKDAMDAAEKFAEEKKIVKDLRTNTYIKNGVIHLFMFEDGSLLMVGYPTTATDKNKFQLHLFKSSANTNEYFFSADGSYKPTLNIDGAKEGLSLRIIQEDFPIVGPFTGEVVFKVKKGAVEIASQAVNIAKTIHASIGTGFVFSTLKNPTNIRSTPLANSPGDSTLLADNPNGNATLCIMATLYPWGRNSLMLTSPSFKDRMGVVVGTTIASSAKNFKNLYLGLQYDFSVGGSFVAGIDIAERQKILDYDYKFSESKFTGNLNDKLYKSVGAGFFFGVQVDSRIFAKMFAN